MDAVWGCGRCEKVVPEKKIQMPNGDFGAVIGHHCAKLQRSLVMKYQQVVEEREREHREAIDTAKRECDELRARLNMPMSQPYVLPPTRSPRHQTAVAFSPGARYITASPRPGNRLLFDEAMQLGRLARHPCVSDHEAMPVKDALRSVINTLEELQTSFGGGAASLRSPVSFGTGSHGIAPYPESGRLRSAHSHHQDFLVPAAAQTTPVHPEPTPHAAATPIVLPLEAYHTPTTPPESVMNTSKMDTNASMAVSVGDMSHVVNYRMFQLWEFWTEISRGASYCDKILDTLQRKRSRTQQDLARLDQVHQADLGRWVIPPASPFCLFWNLLFMIVLTFDCVMLPMQVFPLPTTGALEYCGYAGASFWTLDLALSFFVGYYTKEGQIVMEHWRIVRSYATTWLLPDLVVIALDWMSLVSVDDSAGMEAVGAIRIGKVLRSSRVFRVLRVLRIRKLREAVLAIDEVFTSKYFAVLKSIILNMFAIMATSHLVGCAWYYIGVKEIVGYPSWVTRYDFDEQEWGYQYLTALHWSLTQFTPGSMSVQPQNVPERGFAVVVLLFGMIIFSSIVSSITAATNSLKNIHARYDQQLWTLKKYFREQRISTDVSIRVQRYCDSVIKAKEQRVGLHEVELLNRLPQSLKQDVMLELYDQYLVEHQFFRGLLLRNRNLVQKLCCHALSEIVLASGDELFLPGQIAVAMYHVALGELRYTMEHVQSSRLVRQGEWFCEVVLWTHWVHQGRMVTTTETELVAMDYRKFHEIVGKYQSERKWAAEGYGKAFVNGMNELASVQSPGREEDESELTDLLVIDAAVETLREGEDLYDATVIQSIQAPVAVHTSVEGM